MRDFLAAVRDHVVLFDGSMGATLEQFDLTQEDYGGLEGKCHEALNLHRPDVIENLHASMIEAGAEVVSLPGSGAERVEAALAELGRRGITSVLLEGGATLAAAFLEAGEIDELRVFVAPKLLGGADARPLLAGTGAERIAEAQPALALACEPSGEDILIKARLREW